ncbi:hypothetical protein M9H77_16917 [Catharanthus roseus]|uniref:Uncharacterized protein n=1 Tax=Catharanthus roseus TaxID=4058 RepID=A0ACC0B350_CATRO|nr:hypothetical protein M9H77_16917 [Catharanthus roseus]
MVEEINKRRLKNLPTAVTSKKTKRRRRTMDMASRVEEREEEEIETQLSREEKKGKIKESTVCQTEERKRDLNRSKPQRAARVKATTGTRVCPARPGPASLTNSNHLVFLLRPIRSS